MSIRDQLQTIIQSQSSATKNEHVEVPSTKEAVSSCVCVYSNQVAQQASRVAPESAFFCTKSLVYVCVCVCDPTENVCTIKKKAEMHVCYLLYLLFAEADTSSEATMAASACVARAV